MDISGAIVASDTCVASISPDCGRASKACRQRGV